MTLTQVAKVLSAQISVTALRKGPDGPQYVVSGQDPEDFAALPAGREYIFAATVRSAADADAVIAVLTVLKGKLP
jgi:hypothetical protein